MPIEFDDFKKQAEYFKKANRRLKKWITFLAIVLTGIAAIYIINNLAKFKLSFHGPNNDATAYPHMNNFRGGIHRPNRSMGVYYTPEDLRSYINDTFNKLLDKQLAYQKIRRGQNGPDSFPYHKYTWMIGFYWMKKDRKNALSPNRLDFYVIPTLVDTLDDPKHPKVVDYYTDKDSVYYHGKIVDKANKLTTEDAVAYDEGQLWP